MTTEIPLETKVLVIEDDVIVRTLVVRLLEAAGFQVVAVTGGQEGIERTQVELPALVICDVMMPQIDGYEVLRQIRQNPQTVGIPFIFLTAKAERSDFRYGMELGADDYLTKPFTREELLTAIMTRLTKQATLTQPYLMEMKQTSDRLHTVLQQPVSVEQLTSPNTLQPGSLSSGEQGQEKTIPDDSGDRPQTDGTGKRTISIEQMRIALKHNQFYLEYQPQVNLVSGRIIGVESLLRWHHPELGVLYPNQFLPLAETSEFIFPLSRWVLEQVCLQTKVWRLLNRPTIQAAVNLSLHYARQPNLGEAIAQIFEETVASPNMIALDFSEAALMDRGNTSFQTLQHLKTLGVGLYVDDFGMGFSSIAELKRLPLDGLKIDRSFLKDLTIDPSTAGLIRTIVTLGQNLNLKVIAEGVETQGQFHLLKQMGCYGVRGYCFSPPVSAEEIQTLLDNDQRLC